MEMQTFLYLGDVDEEEHDEIKALVDSGADLIEIDDTLADKNYALDKGLNFFLFIIHVKVYEWFLVFNTKM